MTRSTDAPAQAPSAAELRVALERALSCHFGAPRRVAKLESRRSAYSTSFPIEALDVCLDDGSTLQLVLKDLSWRSLSDRARRAKPAFLYDPLREIAVYRAILSPRPLGTATCYGAVIEHALGRYWLLLEKVPGVELYQVGELATWQRVARWLAAFHAQFAEGAATERLAAAPLLRHDGDFYRRWARRARAFSHRADPALAPKIEWLTERYERVVERLVALPPTFIHGEFYASNVLVQEMADGLRVCPVDWEMAALGPGLIDLAALTAGTWTDEQRQALTLAYRDALSPIAGRPLDEDTLLVELDCCRLHLAVQWLGWSPDWSPPPEHAQDWLGEAVGLTEKLGL